MIIQNSYSIGGTLFVLGGCRNGLEAETATTNIDGSTTIATEFYVAQKMYIVHRRRQVEKSNERAGRHSGKKN